MDAKQNIKRKRIKAYFLDAAKTIIMQEGVENVSVRKVADIAGYSYATIYNYFSDLNELLWNVKGAMIWDMVDNMQQEIPGTVEDKNGISRVFKAYIEFYLKNPNVFRFFYLYPISKPEIQNDEPEQEPDFNGMWNTTFSRLVMDGVLEQKDIAVISKIFIYSIHAMLVFYFSENGYMTEEQLFKDLDEIIDYLL